MWFESLVINIPQCLGPNRFPWICWKSWPTWSDGMLHGYKGSQSQTRNDDNSNNFFKPVVIYFLRVLLVRQVQLVFLGKRVLLVFEEIMDRQGAREREVSLGLLEALETKEILEKMDHQ